MTDLSRRDLLAAAAGLSAAAALGPWELASAAGSPPVRALARECRGPVLTPASAGWSRARQVFNARYNPTNPAAVLFAEGVRDVQAAVRWATRYGVRITARSGGHSYAGYSVVTGGLVVDLSRLSRITVNRAAGTVDVEAGVRLMKLYATLSPRGLTVPGGSCASVGVGGLALGGGVGLAGRKFGLTADNIVEMTCVTADGRARTVNSRSNPDLFWALRGGGGGNFGIVTRFTFRTHPVTSAWFFLVSFPWSEAVGAFGAWQELAPFAPDDLYALCTFQTDGATPQAFAFGQYFGSGSQLDALLRPLTQAGGSIQKGRLPYQQLMLRWAGCTGLSVSRCLATQTPQRFAAKSDYVAAAIPRAGRQVMKEWIEARNASPRLGSGAIIADAYGGAINRVKPSATAFVHRNQRFSFQYFSAFSPGATRATDAWMNGLHAAMRPYVSGFAYQNYIDPGLATWKRAYYGSNYARLVDVKTKYDPGFLFRFRQAIPPR